MYLNTSWLRVSGCGAFALFGSLKIDPSIRGPIALTRKPATMRRSRVTCSGSLHTSYFVGAWQPLSILVSKASVEHRTLARR